MRRYDEQKFSVVRSVGNLVKSIATRFQGIKMCFSKANPKWCLPEIFKQNYFSKQPCRNWTRLSEQNFGSKIDIDDGYCVFPLDMLVLVGVSIYKQSFTFGSTMQMELAEAHFESKEWITSFKKGATKAEMLNGASINGVLKACPRQSLSDTCRSRKKTTWNMFFQLFGQQRLLKKRFWVTTDADLWGKRKNSASRREADENGGE